MRIATIDVGTNTALLLVADCSDGRMVPLHEAQRFVRLGEGVDATGHITTAALRRLCDALHAYRDVAESWDATTIIVGATSASRDAQNKQELIDTIRRETGLTYEILSGEEEALWSFRGAVSAFPDLAGPCAVVDVGGGSTELIVGDASGHDDAIAVRRSLNVGSVRLTERFFDTQPPAPDAVRHADDFIRRVLQTASLRLDEEVPLIGAAGTAVALALVHRGVSTWTEVGSPAVTLTADEIRQWREHLLTSTYDDVLALDPSVLEGRADVFPMGVLILERLVAHLGAPALRISPRGLRHGLALRFLREVNA